MPTETTALPSSVFFLMFVIFSGAAITATLALYARQAMLIGYIVLGIALGPWGLQLVTEQDAPRIKDIAHIGIVFLLFLLGLNLKPESLLKTLGKTTFVTIASSLIFGLIGATVSFAFGYDTKESIVIGVSMIFSSTILGLKLLPTTVLHHKRTGGIIISILLFQDLIAILMLLILKGLNQGGGFPLMDIALSMLSLPLLGAFAWAFGRYVLLNMIMQFSKIQEYIFLTAIGWCLGMAELAEHFKLSHEIGAFLAGIVLATSPIALFIAESLKPLRDFFLVMFFFSLGAGLNLKVLPDVMIPAIILAALMLVIKAPTFSFLFRQSGEENKHTLEMGWRLGQISEFSLLIAVLAQDMKVISPNASYLIQVATLMTFMFSSYFIVMNYPSPIAVSDKLRRD
ncbi:MAG: hypothetical protein RIT27_1701 [Pseudomonadota bacterium]|jgi:Kef-type K+ transport system membrane component KefB